VSFHQTENKMPSLGDSCLIRFCCCQPVLKNAEGTKTKNLNRLQYNSPHTQLDEVKKSFSNNPYSLKIKEKAILFLYHTFSALSPSSTPSFFVVTNMNIY
jgi:hypothetical protein